MKNSHKKLDRNLKLIALIGRVDESGRYSETYVENVVLGSLPKEAIRQVRTGHDITIQVVPKHDIAILAKSPQDIQRYVESMGENHTRELLYALSKYNDPEDGIFWTVYDFEH